MEDGLAKEKLGRGGCEKGGFCPPQPPKTKKKKKKKKCMKISFLRKREVCGGLGYTRPQPIILGKVVFHH